MTIEEISSFVEAHLGKSLSTIGGRSTFKVRRSGFSFVFELESGKTRNESLDWMRMSLKFFNSTGSFLTTDYPDTQNASYVLGLFKAVSDRAQDTKIMADLDAIQQDSSASDTTKSTLIAARLGQGKFRDDLIGIWNSQCAVTGCSILSAIRASHIKPWRICSNVERLDPNNGLPLIATLDALFDVGLITFKNTGELVASSEIPDSERILMGIKGMKLRKPIPSGTAAYLEYHRSEVFIP